MTRLHGAPSVVQPESCGRFSHCNAPLCPLDGDWRKRVHLKGEPACFYLREAVKPGGRALLEGVLPSDIVAELLRVAPEMMGTAGNLRRTLQRASRQGSKLAAAMRLNGVST